MGIIFKEYGIDGNDWRGKFRTEKGPLWPMIIIVGNYLWLKLENERKLKDMHDTPSIIVLNTSVPKRKKIRNREREK